jgi:serine/threonine protein kinase
LAGKGAAAACPHCGFDESRQPIAGALPCRAMLKRRHWVGRALGEAGDFGMAYLAWDNGLDSPAVVQEYLPREFAGREGGGFEVSVRSPDDRQTFRLGLEAFVEEAEIFARFDHPHLVRVRDSFEANGTAYLAMDRLEGEILGEWLERQPGKRIDPARALEIMLPVLDALERVHRRGFLLRDINPRALFLTRSGCVALPNFGAARLAIGERGRSGAVALSPDYAPYEQFHSRGQGPWTDVYACAAVLYRMVVGEPPMAASVRVLEDKRRDPRGAAPDLPRTFALALIQALDINPRLRPHSMAVFRAMLTAQPRAARLPNALLHRAEDIEEHPPARPRPLAREARNEAVPEPADMRRPAVAETEPSAARREAEREKRNHVALIGAILLAATIASGLYFMLELPDTGSAPARNESLPDVRSPSMRLPQ